MANECLEQASINSIDDMANDRQMHDKNRRSDASSDFKDSKN